MTLDEAIKHAEEVAEINENIAYNTEDDNWMDIAQCEKCAEEHRQLADWLKDYKRLLEHQHKAEMPCVSAEEMKECKDIVKKYTPKQEPCGKCNYVEGSPFCLKYCPYDVERKKEQQPCDDTVSRQAVLDVINLNWDYRKNCIRAIEDLPSTTPQQKYGKWIEHPEIETSAPEYLMFYECSECGDKQCFCKSDIHKKRFCNNCGAKMESEGGE